MTTVTEAAKRLIGGDDEEALKSGDLGRICADPLVAQQLGRRLAEAAREIAPTREWSIEDLRDVLEVACRGPSPDSVQILEGRHFRKRLREQCAFAERYADPFACIVVQLGQDRDTGEYASVLDAITDRLRRTDMVFLYKRRFALILPRMRAEAIDSLIERVRRLINVGAGPKAIQDVARLVFPDPEFPDTQSVLDWAEDQLR
ncbi:MAG: hypothetical protein AAGF12_37445 [Myxococcota bacterium]